jgi:pyruvate,orthophosphate dikinase
MGQSIYKTEEADLLGFFIDSVIDLGFQTPNIGGVGNDWQIKANTAHIQNIRTWLLLIELSPRRSTRLLSALTIYLALYGVFIKDTDLFPREISKLLNSDIRPVYNQVKQLARLFPAYFNDIGAEGKLRDISTKIDEITHRKDKLIHFLRKQSHVESSNQIIALMEGVFKFWETKDKSMLQSYIPPCLIEEISRDGIYIDGLNKVMSRMVDLQLKLPTGLLNLDENSVSRVCRDTRGVSETEAKRFELAVSLYKLLNQKYNLGLGELNHYLDQLEVEAFPGLSRLKDALAETDIKVKLNRLLDYLKTLKKLILSSKIYEVREDIYKKRHITIDIPSMYGSYHEMKFDALGLTFRIEAMVNVLFEQLVHNIDLTLITKATFYQIHSRLRLFDKALKLDGIHSGEFERHLEFLTQSLYIKGFTLTQYLDIIRGFSQAVKNIIIDYYHNLHDRNLTKILSQTKPEQLQCKYLSNNEMVDKERLQHRVSEIFYRECLTSSLGLQQLDFFLTRIHNTLFQQLEKLPKEQLYRLLLFDPKSAITTVDEPESRVLGIIHLGNKGYNLVNLKEVGLPVPPALIITTEVFRVRDIIDDYKPAQKNFRAQLKRQIRALEKKAGKKFGDPSNPLLLSVRSGSAISQPGMMNTFLDVGINETIAEGIAIQTGNKWFAWDSYRRFLQCYGMAFGMERDIFDAIIAYFKKKWHIRFKRKFSGEQMREVALEYKGLIQNSNIEVEDEPYEQLFLTIKKVFDSWDADKAKTYRQIMGISEDWGTAVTIQAMVYGNIAKDSGTGVFFTHNPQWSSDNLKLWGDFTLGNQGEDVVSGLVRTLPISIYQQDIEMRDTDVTLESHFPEIYKSLVNWSKELINRRGWSSQEIEFTFEGPTAEDLYILQSRDMVFRKRKKESKFDLNGDETPILLGHGIGVSGGAIAGRLVFSLDEIEKWRALEPHRSLILARGDTVPDDIREIHAADGLLTAKGGLTSHASVVAHRLGKICVVGCSDLICNEPAKIVYFNETCLNSGDFISIDGHEGSVYQGLLKLKLKLSISSFDATVKSQELDDK